MLAYLNFLYFKKLIHLFLVDAQECGVNYFKCKKNGKCILGAFQCDGEFDCDDDDDKSDEENCKGMIHKISFIDLFVNIIN